MNNDNKVETVIAGLNCWASYATYSSWQIHDDLEVLLNNFSDTVVVQWLYLRLSIRSFCTIFATLCY